jgi:hypothetical protein
LRSPAATERAALGPVAAQHKQHGRAAVGGEQVEPTVAVELGKRDPARQAGRAGRRQVTVGEATAALVDEHRHARLVARDDDLRLAVAVQIADLDVGRRIDARRVVLGVLVVLAAEQHRHVLDPRRRSGVVLAHEHNVEQAVAVDVRDGERSRVANVERRLLGEAVAGDSQEAEQLTRIAGRSPWGDRRVVEQAVAVQISCRDSFDRPGRADRDRVAEEAGAVAAAQRQATGDDVGGAVAVAVGNSHGAGRRRVLERRAQRRDEPGLRRTCPGQPRNQDRQGGHARTENPHQRHRTHGHGRSAAVADLRK